jgi:hypothetical protein
MMKSRIAMCFAGVLSSFAVAIPSATAQDAGQAQPPSGGGGTDVTTPSTVPQPAPVIRSAGDPSARPSPDASAEREALFRHRIAELFRLHDLLRGRLEPSVEQRNAIERLFDGYIRDIREGRVNPARSRATFADESKMPRLYQLQDQLTAATNAGDKATVQQVVESIRILKVDPAPIRPPRHFDFVDTVAAEMKPEQRERFYDTIRRWRTLEPGRTSRDAPIRVLRRALRDPELGLPPERRDTVDKIVVAAMKSVPIRERDPAALAEAEAKARAEVLERLTDEERTKLQSTLAWYRDEKWETLVRRTLDEKGSAAGSPNAERTGSSGDSTGPAKADVDAPKKPDEKQH